MRYVALVMITFCIQGSAAQAVGDYWPLQVGNRWVYEHTTGVFDQVDSREQVVLEVLGKEEVEGHVYFRLSNGLLVRKDDEGNIVEYNDRFEKLEERELLVFDFASPESEEEPGHFRYWIPYAAFPPTIGGASMSKSWASYTDRTPLRPTQVPAGTFTVGYRFSYADWTYATGVSFALGIGIIRSGQGSDTDWEAYELVEAIINGRKIGPSSTKCATWGQIKSQF